MMELLIDAEMKMFKGIETPVIFIQNVLTDMILGLGMKDVFAEYHNYIIKKYNYDLFSYIKQHKDPLHNDEILFIIKFIINGFILILISY